MKKYKTLLFDVDNTLLDFDTTEKYALRLLFEDEKLPLTSEIENHYRIFNKSLWKMYEDGKLSRTELVNTRFAIFLKEYGIEVDGVLLEQKYRRFLNEGHHLIDGAVDLIKNLQRQYDLYVVTNGDSKTQEKRLRDSGLFPFFKDIFVSEDTGFQKPMKEYFDYVFSRIPNFVLDNGLIIGDTLNSDIRGGHIAGIDTCWYNPNKVANHTDLVPTHQIQKLEELYHIL